ncbi:MAG: hypothetical protein AB7J35_04985 [Dehalococcoidia bacterium]
MDADLNAGQTAAAAMLESFCQQTVQSGTWNPPAQSWGRVSLWRAQDDQEGRR